jgi:hypothetical protein
MESLVDQSVPLYHKPDPEDPVTLPQLGAFDGVLVDGHLLPKCKISAAKLRRDAGVRFSVQ